MSCDSPQRCASRLNSWIIKIRVFICMRIPKTYHLTASALHITNEYLHRHHMFLYLNVYTRHVTRPPQHCTSILKYHKNKNMLMYINVCKRHVAQPPQLCPSLLKCWIMKIHEYIQMCTKGLSPDHPTALRIATEIAMAMSSVHQQGIMHRYYLYYLLFANLNISISRTQLSK